MTFALVTKDIMTIHGTILKNEIILADTPMETLEFRYNHCGRIVEILKPGHLVLLQNGTYAKVDYLSNGDKVLYNEKQVVKMNKYNEKLLYHEHYPWDIEEVYDYSYCSPDGYSPKNRKLLWRRRNIPQEIEKLKEEEKKAIAEVQRQYALKIEILEEKL